MIKILYTEYEGSTRASCLETIALLCKTFCAAIIVQEIQSGFSLNNISISLVIATVALAIIGITFSAIAAKIGPKDFDKKIRTDLNFAIAMGTKHPDNVEFYMSLNPEFNAYVLNGKFKPEKPKLRIKAGLITFVFCIAFCIILFFVFNNAGDVHDKVQDYEGSIASLEKNIGSLKITYSGSVQSTIDSLALLNESPDLTVEDLNIYFPEQSIVLPMYYENIDKYMSKIDESPSLDVDDAAKQFFTDTKALYAEIDDICEFYSSGQYLTDPDTGLTLHKQILNDFDSWEEKADSFKELLKDAHKKK